MSPGNDANNEEKPLSKYPDYLIIQKIMRIS